jgi:hypothetical protein
MRNISQISELAAPTNNAKNPSTSKSPLGPKAINEHLDHVFDQLQDDSFLWMMINPRGARLFRVVEESRTRVWECQGLAIGQGVNGWKCVGGGWHPNYISRPHHHPLRSQRHG